MLTKFGTVSGAVTEKLGKTNSSFVLVLFCCLANIYSLNSSSMEFKSLVDTVLPVGETI